MKKSIMMILAVLSLLFLASCGGSRVRDQQPKEALFRTGTEGIVLKFPTNLPVKVFEGDNVDFLLEVRNKGAFPQADETTERSFFEGRIFFGGFDTEILKIKDGDTSQAIDPANGITINRGNGELDGKSPFNLDGGFIGKSINVAVLPLPPGISFYNPKIRAAVNYKYKTIVSQKICVDPDPRGTRIKDKPCIFTESAGSGSQGGPVAVTRIEQDATSGNLLYKITVQNVGRGAVIKQELVNKNPFSEGFAFSEINKVQIEEVKLGGIVTPLACRPTVNNPITLIDGKGIVICTISTQSIKEAFETPLTVKLSYGYTESIETPIEVFEQVKII
ncbi:hypothetical protein HYU14_06710 [Candidatus Woesearchaeota archaeon]|nr:hypothetical protein [Candidatus Woesearchaeota archaeon]